MLTLHCLLVSLSDIAVSLCLEKKLNNLDLSKKFGILCSSTFSSINNKSPEMPLVWDVWFARLKGIYLLHAFGLCQALSDASVYLGPAL